MVFHNLIRSQGPNWYIFPERCTLASLVQHNNSVYISGESDLPMSRQELCRKQFFTTCEVDFPSSIFSSVLCIPLTLLPFVSRCYGWPILRSTLHLGWSSILRSLYLPLLIFFALAMLLSYLFFCIISSHWPCILLSFLPSFNQWLCFQHFSAGSASLGVLLQPFLGRPSVWNWIILMFDPVLARLKTCFQYNFCL